MRIPLLAATTCAAALMATGASAAVLNGPLGMQAAISETDVIEKVHCVPGWPHHRYRPHNGCYRRGYWRGPPAYYYSGYPSAYYYGGYPSAYYYGGGPFIAGPGFAIGFGIGPRRWGGWGRRW
jgi:hypothetical protein